LTSARENFPYRPDIDGLRAVAVLSVILFHAFPGALRGGYIGVDIFFVISGFLISSIILGNLASGTFSFWDFYQRRIRRIFPALILVVLASYLCGWFSLFAGEFLQFGKHTLAAAGFGSNFVLWSESGYFDQDAEKKPLLHLWSLANEEQFYLVWPLIAVLAWKRHFLWVCVGLLALSFAVNIALISSSAAASFYSPLSRAWELLFGAALAYCLTLSAATERGRGAWMKLHWGQTTLARSAMSWAGIGLIVFALAVLHKGSRFPGWWALVPCLGATMLLLAGPQAQVNRGFLSSRVMVWIGKISYPLYLWHWPVLAFMFLIEGVSASRTERFLALALSFLLAWLTYRYVEIEVRRRSSDRLSYGLLGLMLLCAGLGAATWGANGFPGRAISQSAHSDLSWPASYGQTPECLSRYRDGGYCMLIGEQAPDVALIGDSLANSYFFGLAAAYRAHGHQLVQVGAGGCPPFLDVWSGFQSKEDWCLGVGDKVLRRVAAEPGIKVVILAANWHLYAVGARLSPAQNENRPPWSLKLLNSSGSELVNSQAFQQGLRKTLEYLERHGKKVIFLDQTPELNQEITNNRWFERDPSKTRVPSKVVAAYLADYQQFSIPVLREFPRVIRIDPTSVFCKDTECVANDGPILLYRDEIHLSKAGSNFLGKALTLPAFSP
jgi:peptidoglycan/LPS O-acetylase OafA/YrhL